MRKMPSAVKAGKSWRELDSKEKLARFTEALSLLERRKRSERPPKTLGEWWKTSDHLQHLTLFSYRILECENRK